MLVLTAVQARYTAFSPKSSEEFTSASRSVKPGLIASGIVSAWTWAATLVRCFMFESSTSNIHVIVHSYKVVQSRINLVGTPADAAEYQTDRAQFIGISGPWWYGGMIYNTVLLCSTQSDYQLVQPSRSCCSRWWVNKYNCLP